MANNKQHFLNFQKCLSWKKVINFMKKLGISEADVLEMIKIKTKTI
jgi:hypothetical protein